jgi:hypothetical protein
LNDIEGWYALIVNDIVCNIIEVDFNLIALTLSRFLFITLDVLQSKNYSMSLRRIEGRSRPSLIFIPLDVTSDAKKGHRASGRLHLEEMYRW